MNEHREPTTPTEYRYHGGVTNTPVRSLSSGTTVETKAHFLQNERNEQEPNREGCQLPEQKPYDNNGHHSSHNITHSPCSPTNVRRSTAVVEYTRFSRLRESLLRLKRRVKMFLSTLYL